MGIPLFQVDAFTDVPFRGNPAAVCLLNEPAEEAWMQRVAEEMNLSETAFLFPASDGYRLRWFTPTVEVDLCGHATLASAHVLWREGCLRPEETAVFHTRSGRLTVQNVGDGMEMDFPAAPAEPAEVPPDLEAALGVTFTFTGRNRWDYLVEVRDEETLRNIRPDFALLSRLPIRGVSVTAVASTPGFDFVSRFFAPGSGIDEDPVTGSAHCKLGPYWGAKLGKTKMVGFQASARGGTVKVTLKGDRVLLGGQAVTVLRGEWLHEK